MYSLETVIAVASPHDTELIKAAVKGDYPAALLAIESGADINFIDENGFTPLMISSNFGRERIVKLLIRRGADVNLKALNGDTALSISEAKNYSEIAEMIKKKIAESKDESNVYIENEKSADIVDNISPADDKADVSNTDDDQQSVSKTDERNIKSSNAKMSKRLTREKREQLNEEMLQAALKGDTDMVKNLFEEGANINARNREGMTILIFAINQNSKDMYNFAIKNGIDINICDASGNNALLCAFTKENRAVCEELISMGAVVDPESEKTLDIFIKLIKNNDMLGAGFLVKNKINLKSVVIDEIPLLIYCIQKNMDEAMQLFIKNGADVNAKDKNGKTVLMYASEFSSDEIIGLLKSSGADESAKDSNDKTAAYYGSEEYKKDKFMSKVKSEINLCRDYFISLMNVEAENKKENSAAALRECNAQIGYVSLITKDDDDVLIQKRAPFSQPFNDRIAGLKKLLDEKNKDEKTAGALLELLNKLTPFKEKSDKLDVIVSKNATGGGSSGSGGAGIKENDVDEYINAYIIIKEDVEKNIAAVETAAGITAGADKTTVETVENVEKLTSDFESVSGESVSKNPVEPVSDAKTDASEIAKPVSNIKMASAEVNIKSESESEIIIPDSTEINIKSKAETVNDGSIESKIKK